MNQSTSREYFQAKHISQMINKFIHFKYLFLIKFIFIIIILCANKCKSQTLRSGVGTMTIMPPEDFPDKIVKRYFFIGYNCANRYSISSGNFFNTGDQIPILDSLRNATLEMVNEDNIRQKYTFSDCMILSIYEFKNYKEYTRFKGQTKK